MDTGKVREVCSSQGPVNLFSDFIKIALGGYGDQYSFDACKTCTNCSPGEFWLAGCQPSIDQSIDRQCESCKKCAEGEYIGTPCKPGNLTSGGVNTQCKTCKTCELNQYIKTPCNKEGRNDTECEICKTWCGKPGNSYIIPCSDRINPPECKACDNIECGENQERVGSCGTSMKPEENGFSCVACDKGYYQPKKVTIDGESCQKCPDLRQKPCNHVVYKGSSIGFFGTDDFEEGIKDGTYKFDLSSYVEKTPATEYEFTDVSGCTICASLTVCGDESYEDPNKQLDGNKTVDRTCLTASTCSAKQYEKHPLTALSDRVCSDITPKCKFPEEYQSAGPTATSDRECKATSNVCRESDQEEGIAPTLTSDRVCWKLCVSTEYEEISGTSTTDRICKRISECDLLNSEVEDKPPTRTSDRTCKADTEACSKKGVDFYPVLPDVEIPVLSDGSSFMPHCASVADTCKFDTFTQDQCARLLCKRAGLKFKSFSSAKTHNLGVTSNNLCDGTVLDERETAYFIVVQNSTEILQRPQEMARLGYDSAQISAVCEYEAQFGTESVSVGCIKCSNWSCPSSKWRKGDTCKENGGTGFTCEPAVTCSAGTFISVDQDATNPRKCAPCGEGMWQTKPNARGCKDWTPCDLGEYIDFTKAIPSATVDKVCSKCGPPPDGCPGGSTGYLGTCLDPKTYPLSCNSYGDIVSHACKLSGEKVAAIDQVTHKLRSLRDSSNSLRWTGADATCYDVDGGIMFQNFVDCEDAATEFNRVGSFNVFCVPKGDSTYILRSSSCSESITNINKFIFARDITSDGSTLRPHCNDCNGGEICAMNLCAAAGYEYVDYLGIAADASCFTDSAGSPAIAITASCTRFLACDQSCDQCPKGQFDEQNCDASKPPICKDCSICNQNEYQSQTCDFNRNVVCKECTPCEDGFFPKQPCNGTTTVNHECIPCTNCSGHPFPGKYIIEHGSCNAENDTKCDECIGCPINHFATESDCDNFLGQRDCKVCQNLVCGMGQYRVGECVNTTDGYSCTGCSICKAGTFKAGGCGDGILDSDCQPCEPGTFNTHEMSWAGTWSRTDIIKCKPWKVTSCSPGFHLLALPNATNDGVCLPCDDDSYQDKYKFTGIECIPITVCDPILEFELLAPGPSNNRVCKTASVCTSGQQYEAIPLTTTMDRLCLSCTQVLCPTGQYNSAECNLTANRICSPLISCSPTQYEVKAPTPYSQRECAEADVCPPGFRMSKAHTAIENTSCEACNGINEYQNWARQESCKFATECGIGQLQISAITTSSDRICISCPKESYQPVPGIDNEVCKAASECSEGMEERSAPTASTDRICVPCDGITTFKSDQGQSKCLNVKECGVGERQVAPPSASHDRICEPCPNETFQAVHGVDNKACSAATVCSPGSREMVPYTQTSDRVCSLCDGFTEYQDKEGQTECLSVKNCSYGERQVAAPTATSDRKCEICPINTFMADSEHTNTGCISQSKCGGGQFVQTVATITSDTVCVACPEEQYRPPGLHMHKQCLPVKFCSAGERQVIGPTPFSDRVCVACGPNTFIEDKIHNQTSCNIPSLCKVGEYAESLMNSTSDTQCIPCPSGHFRDGGLHLYQHCKLHHRCRPSEFVLAPPTSTSDTVCAPCNDGSFSEIIDSTDTEYGPVSCTNWTICKVGTYIGFQGNSSSDRKCIECDGLNYFQNIENQESCFSTQRCSRGEYEISPPTQTSDRICGVCIDGKFQPEVSFVGNSCTPHSRTCPVGSFECVPGTTVNDKSCCPCGMSLDSQNDIIFILDESASVESVASGGSPGNFNFQLDLIRSFVGDLDDNLDGSRIGIVTYSSGARLHLKPKNNQTKAEVLSVLGPAGGGASRIQYLGGAGYIHAGISQAVDSISDGSPRGLVLVIVTDGVAGSLSSLLVVLNKLDENVQRFAIGINTTPERSELSLIAGGDQSRVLIVTSFKELNAARSFLRNGIGLTQSCPLGTFASAVCSDVSDRVCEPWKSCFTDDTQYEASPPTSETNRLCKNITNCNPQTQFEKKPATLTSDRECASIRDACKVTEHKVRMNITTLNLVCVENRICDTEYEYEVLAPTTTTDRVCAIVTPCRIGNNQKTGTYESMAPTPTSNRRCSDCSSLCPKGSYVISVCNQTSDLQCAVYTKCNIKSEHETAEPTAISDRQCMMNKICTTSEFEKVKPTTTTDRVCVLLSICGPNQHTSQQETSVADRICTDNTICNSTMEWISIHPTASSDRICSGLRMCNKNEFESRGPSIDADRICEELSICSNGTYISINETLTTDRVCNPITTCKQDEYMSVIATKYSDNKCSHVSSCKFDEWVSALETPTTDRICSSLTVCTSDQWESLEPTAASDRNCQEVKRCTDNEYISVKASWNSDTKCEPLLECNVLKEYEFLPPKEDANRVCESLTICLADIEYETSPPSATQDRHCTAVTIECKPGTYLSALATPTSDIVCNTTKMCTNEEFESIAPTMTSDRVCTSISLSCLPIEEYEAAAPTSSTDRICKKVIACLIDEYEVAPPTSTENRICNPITLCKEGVEFQSAPATYSSDTECRILTHCEEGEWAYAHATLTSDRECIVTSTPTTTLQPNIYDNFYDYFTLQLNATSFFAASSLLSISLRRSSLSGCASECIDEPLCAGFEFSENANLCILSSSNEFSKAPLPAIYSDLVFFPRMQCPKNCGQPQFGGGSCRTRSADEVLICASCNDNRIRMKGFCLLEVHCRARKVQSGKLKGLGCKCSNPHCHNCKRKSVSQGGDICTVCRDGWYLHNGDCVEKCPSKMTSSGISLFRRRCVLPYVCKSGKIYDGPLDGTFTQVLSNRNEPYGCRCPGVGNQIGGNCFACEHRPGGVGDVCLRCNNAKYLLGTMCIDICPNGTIGIGFGNYGRKCVP